MARSTKKRLGKDAKVSIIVRYLHPSRLISTTMPNVASNQRIEDCIVIRMAVKKVNRRDQLVIVMKHDNFKTNDGAPEEIYSVSRWCKVQEEGPSEYYFDNEDNGEAAQPSNEIPEKEMEVELPDVSAQINHRGLLEGDISQMDGQVEVDDDNEPAPENVPAPNSNVDDVFIEWGHDGVCQRRQAGGLNTEATLINFGGSSSIPSIIQLFEMLFPKEFIQVIIIKETNKKLDKKMTYGEFFVWIGLWFFMGTTHFGDRREFWSSKAIDAFEGTPFRFNDFMSRNRFENILCALTITDRTAPTHTDRFWEVRQLIYEWNANMIWKFSPSWISCLDESMSKWVGKYTCPGYMCVPRKPWPLGNEYHTIACGTSGVLYQLEIVEGKDTPKQALPKTFSEMGKTVGLLLRLTKPLWGSSKVVVLDSGFCVLKGIAELRKKGVFAAALVKKRRYWPKHIKGEAIKTHFQDKEVGTVDAMKGELDSVKVELHCLKEPDYTMTLMSSYGTLELIGEQKSRTYIQDNNTINKLIKYPELVYNHFSYRDAVDSHNSSRMFPIAMEEVWKTTRWPCRVFCFMMAVTEVNCRLVLTHIYKQPEYSQQEFRKKLSKEFLNNGYLFQSKPPGMRKSRRVNRPDHCLVSLPKNRTFRKTSVVFCKTAYIQLVCSYCGACKIRTYCPCTPGKVICTSCFADHIRLLEK